MFKRDIPKSLAAAHLAGIFGDGALQVLIPTCLCIHPLLVIPLHCGRGPSFMQIAGAAHVVNGSCHHLSQWQIHGESQIFT